MKKKKKIDVSNSSETGFFLKWFLEFFGGVFSWANKNVLSLKGLSYVSCLKKSFVSFGLMEDLNYGHTSARFFTIVFFEIAKFRPHYKTIRLFNGPEGKRPLWSNHWLTEGLVWVVSALFSLPVRIFLEVYCNACTSEGFQCFILHQ